MFFELLGADLAGEALFIVAQMQSLVPLQHCVGAEPLDADAVSRVSGWGFGRGYGRLGGIY